MGQNVKPEGPPNERVSKAGRLQEAPETGSAEAGAGRSGDRPSSPLQDLQARVVAGFASLWPPLARALRRQRIGLRVPRGTPGASAPELPPREAAPREPHHQPPAPTVHAAWNLPPLEIISKADLKRLVDAARASREEVLSREEIAPGVVRTQRRVQVLDQPELRPWADARGRLAHRQGCPHAGEDPRTVHTDCSCGLRDALADCIGRLSREWRALEALQQLDLGSR